MGKASGLLLLRSQSGVGLIQIIIGVGIVGVVATALMSLMESQRRFLSATEQKQDVLALRSTVLQQVDLPQICGWQFRDLRFDATGITATGNSTLSIPVRDNTIYGGDNSNRVILAREGQRAGRGPASPQVSQIRLTNFRRAAADRFTADLMVAFDPNSTVVGLRESHMATVQFVTDPASPADDKRILSCTGRSSLFPGWPDMLNCGDTVYHIRGPGAYSCIRGGEDTTRSAGLIFDPSTRRMAHYRNETDEGPMAPACQCGPCCTNTMEELIDAGLTR